MITQLIIIRTKTMKEKPVKTLVLYRTLIKQKLKTEHFIIFFIVLRSYTRLIEYRRTTRCINTSFNRTIHVKKKARTTKKLSCRFLTLRSTTLPFKPTFTSIQLQAVSKFARRAKTICFPQDLSPKFTLK